MANWLHLCSSFTVHLHQHALFAGCVFLCARKCNEEICSFSPVQILSMHCPTCAALSSKFLTVTIPGIWTAEIRDAHMLAMHLYNGPLHLRRRILRCSTTLSQLSPYVWVHRGMNGVLCVRLQVEAICSRPLFQIVVLCPFSLLAAVNMNAALPAVAPTNKLLAVLHRPGHLGL